MSRGKAEVAAPRTVLEQRLRELRQTQEEFAEYAADFARSHREPATLSVRHLQRLLAGGKPDGTPLGPVRPATARLLERIFDQAIDELLAPPPDRSLVAYQFRVAIAIVRKKRNVLVVSPRIGQPSGPTWQFPAGIVKPGQAPETVAVRETLAETNIRCVVERHIGRRVHPVTKVTCEYLDCAYVAGDLRNGDIVENGDVAWVRADDLCRRIPIDRIFQPVLKVLSLDRAET